MTALKKAAGARSYQSKNVYDGVRKISSDKAKAYLAQALKAVKKGAAKHAKDKV